jgi:hypothetical protein
MNVMTPKLPLLDRLLGKVGLRRVGAAGHAYVRVEHRRPIFGHDGQITGYKTLSVDEGYNLITNAGAVFIHKQAYDTSGLSTNGLNYIAVSDDLTSGNETATSTTLSNEIAVNGLSRAQGTVTLPTGAGRVTTVAKTFTATGTQSCKKAALFSASSGGTLNHVLDFAATRSLINQDQLVVTFSLTIS